MAVRSQNMNIWVGSETGILKGVNLVKKQALNFCQISCLSRDQEVCALCWSDPTETEVLVASLDGTVKTFSAEKDLFTESRRCGDATQGRFTGLAMVKDSLVTCVETGVLRVWGPETSGTDESAKHTLEINAGKSVCRMRQNPAKCHVVATGGRENGLKIWDLERPDNPTFTAKNLRNDWLDLRQPEWVRDLAFIPDSDKVVTCTGHHQVRIYDPSSPQRRPVLEVKYGEYPLTALSLNAGGDTVVVGNTQGHVAMLDLRKKGLVRGCLKGLAGGVRSIQCHPSLPVVASCGLDRFLRVHSLDDRSLLHKVYLKSRLNCLLLSSRDIEQRHSTGEIEEVKDEGGEDDEVWGAMEEVQEEEEERRKKRRKEVVAEEEEEEENGTEEKTTKRKKK